VLQKSHPEIAEKLMKEAQEDVTTRWKEYQRLASWDPANEKSE